MVNLVANATLDEYDLLTSSDLSSLFLSGSVTTSTASQVVVYDDGSTEQLTLNGTFSAFDDSGFPTDGTITSVVYNVGGSDQLTITGLSLTATELKSYVQANDFVGLFENVFSGADLIKGSEGGDFVAGFNGNDTIYGYGGDDSIDGGAGFDKMLGGMGDDSFNVDSYYDAVYENAGEGTDTVYSNVSYALRANVENLWLGGTSSVFGKGNDGDNIISANNAGNALYGYGGTDILLGGDGRDVLDGGSGDDTMTGGSGNDLYVVDSVGDSVIENAGGGTDFVRASVSYTMTSNVERLYLAGTANIDGTGNAEANLLVGNSGNNYLSGQGANDHIYGGAGNDTLDGGIGNDYLEGGAGQDMLTGGDGRDYFVFREGDTGSTTAADEITDFAVGDRIDFAPIDANGTPGDGNQTFSFIGDSAFGHVAGELRYEQIDGNTYLEADTDGDGTANFMVRIDGLHTITGGDLIL